MTPIRLARLQEAMRASGVEAVAVVPGASLRYLAGLDFQISRRLTLALFPAEGQPAFVVPAMEQARVTAHALVPLRLYPWGDAEGPQEALRRCAGDMRLAGRRVGAEPTALRLLELRALEQAAPGAAVEDAGPLLGALRMTKDADELAAMRAAVQIVEQALRATIGHIRAGMTEIEVANIWEQGIRAAGSRPSFDLFVGGGPNGANPHHTNGARALQPGDLVVLDGGALVDGYASDITRTVALGEPGEQQRRIYDLVLRANAAARAAARPGVSGEQIDRAARAVIEAGGYGPQFLHRTGHGLGLDIHEPPFIVGGSREPLAPGMTFTVEPGIYVGGLGGVRIEDDVVITPDGAETLTTFERELIIIER